MTRNIRHRGFAFTELVVTMTLMVLLVGGFVMSLDGFRRFNRYQLDRQRCIAAALAQLDSLTATDSAITPEEIERLWPQVRVSIERAEGTGVWRGLELVTATAETRSLNRYVTIRLSRYVNPTVKLVMEQ